MRPVTPSVEEHNPFLLFVEVQQSSLLRMELQEMK
jgi:hypothetical protein